MPIVSEEVVSEYLEIFKDVLGLQKSILKSWAERWPTQLVFKLSTWAVALQKVEIPTTT